MGEPARRGALTILAIWAIIVAVAVYILALCGAAAVWAGAFLDALDAVQVGAVAFALTLTLGCGAVLLTWRKGSRR